MMSYITCETKPEISFATKTNVRRTEKKIISDKIKSRKKCFLPPASVKYKNNKLVGSIFGPRFITSNSHPFLETPDDLFNNNNSNFDLHTKMGERPVASQKRG